MLIDMLVRRLTVGNDFAPGDVVSANEFEVSPGHPSIGGRRMAVHPSDLEAFAGVGWQNLLIEPPAISEDRPAQAINARIFYPSDGATDGAGPRWGAGAAVARTPGGWPLIVLVPGLPSRFTSGPDEHRLPCDDDELEPGQTIDLYERWGTTQSTLARAGFVSISLDMAFRDANQPLPAAGAIRIAVEYFRDFSLWSGLLDPTRLGLVGHSTGADNVKRVALDIGGQPPVAFLGPPPVRNLREIEGSPVLTVGNVSEDNGDSTLVYERTFPPRHLVLLRNPYEHYAYFDEICYQLSRVEAEVQRDRTRRALRNFFGSPTRLVGA